MLRTLLVTKDISSLNVTNSDENKSSLKTKSQESLLLLAYQKKKKVLLSATNLISITIDSQQWRHISRHNKFEIE